MSKQDQQQFTRKEVEELLSRLVYSDRDEFYSEVRTLREEYSFDFSKEKDEDDEPSEQDINSEIIDTIDNDDDDMYDDDDDHHGLGLN